jgi:thiamine-phosphate pyrophosphorylase
VNRYLITDRLSIGGTDRLLAQLERALRAGVEFIQIREKDLPPRALLSLTRAVLALPNPHGTRILVNDRMDVALAAGAHGVHLRGDAPAPSARRRVAPPEFLIAVSCHSAAEVFRAEREVADFAVLSPIFPSASKPGYGQPLGREALRSAARAARIPVFALGGITEQNASQCECAGIAAIGLFQRQFAP